MSKIIRGMREIIKNKTVDVVNQNDDYVHHVKNMGAIQSLYKIMKVCQTCVTPKTDIP